MMRMQAWRKARGSQSVGDVAGVKQGGPVSGVRGTLTRGVQEGNGRNLGGGGEDQRLKVWWGGGAELTGR